MTRNLNKTTLTKQPVIGWLKKKQKEKLILRIAQDKGNDGSVNSPQVDVAHYKLRKGLIYEQRTAL